MKTTQMLSYSAIGTSKLILEIVLFSNSWKVVSSRLYHVLLLPHDTMPSAYWDPCSVALDSGLVDCVILDFDGSDSHQLLIQSGSTPFSSPLRLQLLRILGLKFI